MSETPSSESAPDPEPLETYSIAFPVPDRIELPEPVESEELTLKTEETSDDGAQAAIRMVASSRGAIVDKLRAMGLDDEEVNWLNDRIDVKQNV